MFLKILIVAIFVAVTVAVGVFARKHSNSVDGFVLGGRNVGPWLSAFAFGTSYFSAVVFIGYAGQFGWKYGMSVFWVGIGNAVIGSLLAWWVLGPRTREMTQRLKATTMPEFFGKRYNSRALRHCRCRDHLRVPHPVYGICLQRSFAFVRHGFRAAV